MVYLWSQFYFVIHVFLCSVCFRDSPGQLELELPVVQIVQVVRAFYTFCHINVVN